MSEPTVLPPMPTVAPEVPSPALWWRRPLAWGLAGVVVGAGAVGTAWGISSSGPGGFTMRGGLVLDGSGARSVGHDRCTGEDGYDDITTGAEVTVYDAGGGTVATGELRAGVVQDGDCVFTFAIPGVPKGSKFYAVEVSHRGKVTVSAHDAETTPVAETLGN